jgi:20S proteasome subunit beta 2
MFRPLKGGFDFEFVKRNEFLENHGIHFPKAIKTGTTIVGLVVPAAKAVVLGADTRATEGPIVADKNCEKIHYIADNIWCCGAGTAADTENTTALISSQLRLHALATGRQPRVDTALTLLKQFLFRYQGYISAALILGGVDLNGPSLHTIYPHGSTDKLPYVTMGSGSLAAMSIFESEYRENLTLDEGVDLVKKAVKAGIFNDLGSGGNVDVVVITPERSQRFRNIETPNPRMYRIPGGYPLPPGTTPVLKREIVPLDQVVTVTTVPPPSAMET